MLSTWLWPPQQSAICELCRQTGRPSLVEFKSLSSITAKGFDIRMSVKSPWQSGEPLRWQAFYIQQLLIKDVQKVAVAWLAAFGIQDGLAAP